MSKFTVYMVKVNEEIYTDDRLPRLGAHDATDLTDRGHLCLEFT